MNRLVRVAGSVRTRAILSLGVVVALGSGSTLAFWTDTAQVQGSTLVAGTIDLKVNSVDSQTDFTSLSIDPMVPGNSTAGLIVVRNSGTAPLTFTVSSSGTNPDGKNLIGTLTGKVTTDTAVSGTSPARTCAGSAISGSGSSLNGSLIDATIKRTLAAGAQETLCVQATLPSTASQTVSGGATAVTMTFTATQIGG